MSRRLLPRVYGRFERKGVTRTNSENSAKLAAANGSPIRVEGGSIWAFGRDGRSSNMKFLDADVRRPVATVSAIVDEESVVVFGPQEAYIENTNTGQRVPMCRRKGVSVVQLDVRESPKKVESKTPYESDTHEGIPVFRRPL